MLLGEGLSAPLDRALIRLCAEVHVHVRAVAVQAVERLLAVTAFVFLRVLSSVVFRPILRNSLTFQLV